MLTYEQKKDMIKRFYPYTSKEGKEILAKELGYKNGSSLRTVASRIGVSGNYNVPDLEGEVWKTHPAYPKFLVSNMGRLKSKFNSRILKQREHEGYMDCRLENYLGKKKSPRTHRLVAELFLEQPTENGKDQVNHIDSDKLNNKSDNLEWVSNRGNIIHYLENNEVDYSNNYDRLSPAEVHDICERLQEGESIRYIMNINGRYTRARVEGIRQGINYKYISKNYVWEVK